MSRLPSILHVVSTGARVGVSGVVSLLARELSSRGHRIGVLTLTDGPLAERMRAIGIEGRICPVQRAFEPGAVLRVRREIARTPWDVVHTHGQRAMFAGNLAARLEQVPAVVTSFHEIARVKASTSRLWRLYAASEGLLARAATDACVATSRVALEDAARTKWVPRAKLHLIRNAVDPERFHRIEDPESLGAFRRRIGLAETDRVVGALGGMLPVKGHRILIQAIAALPQRWSDLKLVIAGVGPEREGLGRLAAELGLADRVILPGDLPDPELLYACMDVFALPSLAESCPLVLLEAMACRVPVVAAEVGDVPEMLDGGAAGILVPPGEAAALASGIERLLDDRGLGARNATAAETLVWRDYAPQAFADRHLALYLRLLGRTGGGPG
jgi:glycosyltransferase involved in cell wall biosynthesis